jgi:hypothetical protein
LRHRGRIIHPIPTCFEHEGPSLGALFFTFYVDPLNGNSDSKILSRLEHRSDQAFYLLQRANH